MNRQGFDISYGAIWLGVISTLIGVTVVVCSQFTPGSKAGLYATGAGVQLLGIFCFWIFRRLKVHAKDKIDHPDPKLNSTWLNRTEALLLFIATVFVIGGGALAIPMVVFVNLPVWRMYTGLGLFVLGMATLGLTIYLSERRSNHQRGN
jgi:uncharacterized membrane protein YfcA